MLVDLKHSFLSISLFFFFATVACVKKKSPPAIKHEAKHFRWAMAEDCLHLDWTTSFSPSCLQQVVLLMEGLTRTELRDGKFQVLPALAEKYELQSPTVLVFHLKKDVRWSNGAKLEATHFLGAWKHLLTTAQNGTNAALLFPIHNARAYFERRVPFSSVGIKMLDAFTLELTFDAPEPNFPIVLSHPATFPHFSESLLTPPATLGPFLLSQHEFGKTARFTANPHYHGSASSLASIELVFPKLPNNRIHLFQEGQVDFVEDLGPTVKLDAELKKNVQTFPTLSHVQLVFNTQKKPFNQTETRKVFVTAIDRNEFETLFRWPHKLSYSLFTFGSESKPANWFPRHTKTEGKTIVPRLTLGWMPEVVSSDLVENLQMQWIKNLEVKVELIPHIHGQDLQTYLSQQNVAVIETKTNLFTKFGGLERLMGSVPVDGSVDAIEEILAGKIHTFFPLLNKSQTILLKPGIRNLKQNALGLWDFGELIWE